MTIARSLRLFAAAALAAATVLPAAASAADDGGGHGRFHRFHHGFFYRSHPRYGIGVRRHELSGVLMAMSGTTAPATLTVQPAGGATITVTVAATTTIVRRYSGRSGLDELTLGDHITAGGAFEAGSTTTFDAWRIKDWSIQRAFTRVVGRVESVQNGVLTLRVARGRARRSPYWHGEVVQVTLSSSAIVMSGAVTSTVDAVQPGMRVLVLGVYDRVSRTLRAGRVRILGARGQQEPLGGATPQAESTATSTGTVTATSTGTVTATLVMSTPEPTTTPTA